MIILVYIRLRGASEIEEGGRVDGI